MESKIHSFSCSTEVNKILSQHSHQSAISDKQCQKYCQCCDCEVPQTIQESDSATSDDSNNTGLHPRRRRYQTKQILILILLAYGNFWVAACVSLQAPFFPKEAESKGATPTQYGLIFGIYELCIAITSPLFGKMIASVNPILLSEIGLFIAGLSTVIFGLLDQLPAGTPFITACFAVRIVEGISAAAFMTASYVIMAKEFCDRIATTFSLLETCFGLGLILGPTLGGAFYQLGGFLLPFVILGSFLLLGGVFTFILMPKTVEVSQQKSGNLWKFISDPGILLDALAITTSLNFIGFNAATLEPHLRRFNLSPIIMGCIFVISGGIYAITTPIWGRLCDKGFNPKKLCLFGSILSLVGFTFIGPLDFIAIEPQLWLVITSLVFIGLGIASKLVTAFISALHDSIHRRGFPDDISTYGLVSAMFFCACSIGAFIGPTLGGFLLETIGYRKSTLVILVIDIILVLIIIHF
ncbi:MFS-type transporter SLC18B1-like [Oppia nitens]|uniref:MFS-type transporter SLC18B1-like n=1 Tax=Oppia nitens TaxID=1686743 RepID=UPI0023DB394C|nr:MFS-type transporter SLC18B1-like [Oppia nitens]